MRANQFPSRASLGRSCPSGRRVRLAVTSHRSSHQAGLSLVELMVGLAIGLFIVAVAMIAMTRHLRENRDMLVEVRLMQDLRTSTDLISRALRRAGDLNQTANEIQFAAARGGEPMVYRVRNGAIDMRIGDGHWQAMTDTNTLQVTALSLTPSEEVTVLDGYCSRPCPAEGNDATCPPRLVSRRLGLQIEARASADPSLVRRVSTTLQVRNDALLGACPT